MKNPVKPDFSRKHGFKVSDAAKARHAKARKKARAEGQREPPQLHGFGAAPDYLPSQVRDDLLILAIRSDLTAAQQMKLVAHANELAQMPDIGDESIGIQRKQIKLLAQRANKLLEAMGTSYLSTTTTGTLVMYAIEAGVVTPSPLSSETAALVRGIGGAEFMSQAWDMVESLKVIAEHAGSELAKLASKGSHVNDAKARSLVANLAKFYFQLIGKWPPGANTWFHDFAAKLAGHSGLEVGERIVESGIDLAAAPLFTDEEIATFRAAYEPAMPWCDHDWPLPVSSLAPQNCRKCGGGRNGAPGIAPARASNDTDR